MNGKHKQAISALLPSIGVAVVSAGLLKGSERFIAVVGKVKILYGVQFSNLSGLNMAFRGSSKDLSVV